MQRMIENALDWEHLPHLHGDSFTSIDCIEAGKWGWRAYTQLAPPDPSQMASGKAWSKALAVAAYQQPLVLGRYSRTLVEQTLAMRHGAAVELELRLDTDQKSWTTTTLSGPGVGSQVITHVIEHGERDIEITVQFVVPGVPKALQRPIGQYYQALYSVLYDEDESMMSTRQLALDAIKHRQKSAKPVSLGKLEKLRLALPKLVSHGGSEWRVVEAAGELIVHSTLCPHMLGPLGGSPVENGVIECPWHGYKFDIATGQQAGDGRCKLAKPPAITFDQNNNVFLG